MTVTVTPNQPPAAADDVASTKHDRPVEVSVLDNDTDPDGDQLSVSDHTSPEHGTVECSPLRCTYTPAGGYIGPDSFGYTASDGQATSSAVVDVTVRANAAPVARDDTLTAVTGVPADASPTGNDTDVDDDPLTIVGHTNPPHGTVTCSGSTCTYTSAAGFVGDDGFDYTISDGEASAAGHVAVTVQRPCFPGVCIDNGTVLLAVLPQGHLNVENGAGSKAGARPVGLHFLPTHNEATAPGCLCEGWGAADAGTGVTGYANVSTDGVQGISLESFTFTDSTAVSVVTIGGTLRVTQDYHPSPKTPNLYEDTVTIENISGHDLSDIRYRRVMDWDVEPTAFSEYVTIDAGNASELLYDGDNGFLTANPLGARTPILASGSFVDSGPADHGALFDFGFGALATGNSKTFNIFYGAAETEVAAKAAVNAVGAEVFSFGQPSTPDGPTLGTPNTFIFAFGNVGGTAIFTPDAIDDTLTTTPGAPGTVDVLANDTDPNGDALTVTSFTQGAHGTVECTTAGLCTYTPAAGFAGTDAFAYTVSDGHGGTDTASVAVTVAKQNRAPTCPAPSFTTPQDTPLAAQVSCDRRRRRHADVCARRRRRARVGDGRARRSLHLHAAGGLRRPRLVRLQGERRARRLGDDDGVDHRHAGEPRPAGRRRHRGDRRGHPGRNHPARDGPGRRRAHLCRHRRPLARDAHRHRRRPHLHARRRLRRTGLLHVHRTRRPRDLEHRHRHDHRQPRQPRAARRRRLGLDGRGHSCLGAPLRKRSGRRRAGLHDRLATGPRLALRKRRTRAPMSRTRTTTARTA